MKRSGMTLSDLLTYAALALALVVFLAPVLWMLITAVKPAARMAHDAADPRSFRTPLGELHRCALQVGRSEGIAGQSDRSVAFDPALAAARGPRRLRPRTLQHRRRESVLHRAQHPLHAAGRGRPSDVSVLARSRTTGRAPGTSAGRRPGSPPAAPPESRWRRCRPTRCCDLPSAPAE